MSARYLIVGSGIAGLSAAEVIREEDPGARISMVSAEPHAFYSRPGLAYFLDRSLPLDRLRIRTEEEVEALDLERLHGEATRLDPEEHRLGLADGRDLPYDRLLVATGSASLPPPFPGGDLDGVVSLDDLADAEEIARRARSGWLERRRAVVVGGGSTALEIVEGLAARGVETHYLLRGERYWRRVLDPVESAIVERRLVEDGVAVHRETEVVEALGRDGRLRAVRTNAGEVLPCDLLAVAIGVRPRLDLARAGGLAAEKGILTDLHLRTSADDVFAAGDVARTPDPTTGERSLDTLWNSALRQGAAAGRTMAGDPTAYRKEVALNVTRLAGLTTTVVGRVGGDEDPDLVTLTRGQSERWDRRNGAFALSREVGDDRIRILLDDDRVRGAVVMGDQSASRALVRLVREETDVSGLRPSLERRPGHAVERLTELVADGGARAGA